jgi:hypothetical protein
MLLRTSVVAFAATISLGLCSRGCAGGGRPDGTRLKLPMDFAPYAKMTNADLEAIVAYLLTVPSRE